MFLFALTLFATLAGTDSLPHAPAAERRDVDQVSFVVHRQPAIPLVALRLSILANDPAGYAGAGHLFQHLVFPALRDQAARVGAQAQMERGSDAITYTVTGPTAELPYLASILRGALRPPAPTEAELLSANRILAEERLAEWETADRHIRAALRVRLFPNDVSSAGTESSALRLTTAALPGLWARLYRPDRVTVVAVGDVTLEALREAFAELPPVPRAAPLAEAADTVSFLPLAPAEATSGWLGAGYLAVDVDPVVVSVTARLLRDALRQRLAGSEVAGEHWWTHHGQALALVVAAQPRNLAAARQTLNTAPAILRQELTPRRVREAARSLRREMLFFARTPERMTEVLGQFSDRGGSPGAAQQFYADLARVDEKQVLSYLEHLLRSSPVRVEIPPQKLNPKP